MQTIRIALIQWHVMLAQHQRKQSPKKSAKAAEQSPFASVGPKNASSGGSSSGGTRSDKECGSRFKAHLLQIF